MMSKKAGDRPAYDDLIAQLTQIVARLDPTAVPILLSSRERSRPNEIPGSRFARAPSRSLDDSQTVSDGELDLPPPRALPGWLIGVTLLCLALFAAGLVVYLRRDTGEAKADGKQGSAVTPPMRPHRDGRRLRAREHAAVRSGRIAWFYTDANPVNAAAYRELFAKTRRAIRRMRS
jgi:hypothetical protein